MTDRNGRYGVAIVKENCFETQFRLVYKESPVQRIVINIECLHQAININASITFGVCAWPRAHTKRYAAASPQMTFTFLHF